MGDNAPTAPGGDSQSVTSATADISSRGAGDNHVVLLDAAHIPQLTLRAVITGMFLGGLLSVCNIYAGLRVGLGFNMSIAAALLAYGFWTAVHHITGRRVSNLNILENNINQTACSSGASVASAGLIAPIPVLTILTGRTLPWHLLSVWILSVCLIGIIVAIGLRRQMLHVDKLRFPVGIASAEVLQRMYSRGSDAFRRFSVLAISALATAGVQIYQMFGAIPSLALPNTVQIMDHPLTKLGFILRPSPLLLGVGGLIGLRACLSMLIGAVAAWAIGAPLLAANGIVDQPTFSGARAWMIWPGVTLMVVGAMTSFVFSWRSIVAAFKSTFGKTTSTDAIDDPDQAGDVARPLFFLGLLLVLILSVILQASLFEILWWVATVGVLLSFALALVASRVAGEAGITPVGSIGKVSQLLIGAIAGSNPAPNLMAANVTGGAASQSADLLADLKCGHLIGAAPRLQAVAQVCGALTGALVGSYAYLLLVPDPAHQLFTPELPAPAAASWLAVAELFREGFGVLPTGTRTAIAVAAIVAFVLTIVEKTVPARVGQWIPSATSIGFAFVWPASITVTLLAGALIGTFFKYTFANWTKRHWITLCTGVIVGDTLTEAVHGVCRALTVSPG